MALPAHHPTSTSTSNSKTNPPDRIPTHLTRNPSNANPSPIRWGGQLLWYTLDHTHTHTHYHISSVEVESLNTN